MRDALYDARSVPVEEELGGAGIHHHSPYATATSQSLAEGAATAGILIRRNQPFAARHLRADLPVSRR